jgi:hypothetical protein
VSGPVAKSSRMPRDGFCRGNAEGKKGSVRTQQTLTCRDTPGPFPGFHEFLQALSSIGDQRIVTRIETYAYREPKTKQGNGVLGYYRRCSEEHGMVDKLPT